MASSSSSLPKLCFNSSCNQLLGDHSKRGWRRRTGEFADLCDRCGVSFEEGNFCESFHLNASGWRSCESCGKQIHCGCIVSFHMFVLLDAGGIECITCTKKSFILTPNPAWPPPSLLLPGLPERIKDLSAKNWSSIAASGPVPWRQAPSLFNPELHQKTPLEFNMPTIVDKVLGSKKLSNSMDKKENLVFSGRLINGNLKDDASQILENGTSGSKCEEQQSLCVNDNPQSAILKYEPSSPNPDLTLNTASKSEIVEHSSISVSHAQPLAPQPPPPPPPAAANYNGVDSSGEGQAHIGRPQDRNQLLPRYWPKMTEQELQQISGDSNSVITPLFEKVLTASDAGKIGRLVLPKKCAEVYLPPISNPEGIPLPVQDLKGEEWVFQFRFWPNNNSRMYVLEGVSPCIQSMQLRAGDTITFNRLNPNGKLVMGCRKTSSGTDQKKGLVNTRDKASPHGDAIAKKSKPGEVAAAQHNQKRNSVSSSHSAMNKVNLADSGRKSYKVVENKCDAKVKPAAKADFHIKRKNSILGSKSKRLRIETEDMIELKLTWEQAQGLFHPPPNGVPKIVLIDGYEFEEFEEPPIIGRPTIVATNHVGEIIQWAQCEDCYKWRKVPGYAILPSRWTCSENLWDPKRSLCSVDQELTHDELEDLLPSGNIAGAKKMKTVKEDQDTLGALEGLDALANVAIQEEGDSYASPSLHATTKHPRHRPGCSCIVCIQPPSGKGHKHKQTCTCNLCMTVKRRFKTLMLRREIKQSEKAETARQKLQKPEQSGDEDIQMFTDAGNSTSHNLVSAEGSNDDQSKKKLSNQLDLNIRPEREEDLSPLLNSGSITRMLQDGTEGLLKLKKISSSGGESVVSQPPPPKVGVEKDSNDVA